MVAMGTVSHPAGLCPSGPAGPGFGLTIPQRRYGEKLLDVPDIVIYKIQKKILTGCRHLIIDLPNDRSVDNFGMHDTLKERIISQWHT